MTLTEAELDYPWEGVLFVAVDKYNPEVIYVAKRYKDEKGNLQSIILSTETAREAFGPLDGLKSHNDTDVGETTATEDVHIGSIGASYRRTQPKDKKNILRAIDDICQLDWKVVRSLNINLPY